jgi:hypothetical protein
MKPEEMLKSNRRNASKAVKKMDGPANTARILTERLLSRGVNKQISIGQVWAWLNRDKKGIPIEYLVDFEEESGIPREKLRADVPWNEC